MPRTTGIDVRSRGALLDGTAPRRVREASRRWLRGVLGRVRDFARSIAPVKTGRYQRSLRFRTADTAAGVEGQLYSDDVVPKVIVIEEGHSRTQPNRPGRWVFKRSYDHFSGLLGSQRQVLEAELVKDLGR